ncbi:hypothetical protein V8G54_012243 [Vigna mungo]|uniref:Uncharacterized protein n=1 Tax=Vigna mungo TaxID=3915 RepID=A0AAQ3NTU8_VIGMU
MAFNYCHITKSRVSWQPHPKIRVLHLGETFLHLRREKKENVARFASTEDDFENCVGEDDGPGALHNGDKDCRANDEALDLDDSWLMRENEDSKGIVTLMVVAMEVARDGCHGSLQVRLHSGMVTLDDLYGGGGVRVRWAKG